MLKCFLNMGQDVNVTLKMTSSTIRAKRFILCLISEYSIISFPFGPTNDTKLAKMTEDLSRNKKMLETSSLLPDDANDRKSFIVDGRTYLVTRKRWLVLVTVCGVMLQDIFSTGFFAFANDVVSVYFRQPPVMTDLLTTINWVSRGLFTFVIVLAGNTFNLRTMALSSSAFVFTGSLLIAVGISSRKNFYIVVIGQIICAWGSSTALALPQLVSTNWFPKGESGIAVGLTRVCRRVSLVAASLAATSSLGPLSPATEANKKLIDLLGISYTTAYLILAAVTFVTFSCVQLLVTDYPPERVLPEDKKTTLKCVDPWNPMTELKGLLSLLGSKVFFAMLLLFSLFQSSIPITAVLLSSLVLSVFPELNDQYIAVMFCVGTAVGAAGGPLVGLILDRFQNPKYTTLGGLFGVVLSCVTFSLALYFRSTVALYVGCIFLTLTRDFTYVAFQHALLTSMLRENFSTRVKAFSISTSWPGVLVSAYSLELRKIMDAFGPSWAVVAPIPVQLLAAVIWWFSCKYFYVSPAPM